MFVLNCIIELRQFLNPTNHLISLIQVQTMLEVPSGGAKIFHAGMYDVARAGLG